MKKLLACLFLLSSLSLFSGETMEIVIFKKNAVGQYHRAMGVKYVNSQLMRLNKGVESLTPKAKKAMHQHLQTCLSIFMKDDLKSTVSKGAGQYKFEIEWEKNDSEVEFEVYLKDLTMVPEEVLKFLKGE